MHPDSNLSSHHDLSFSRSIDLLRGVAEGDAVTPRQPEVAAEESDFTSGGNNVYSCIGSERGRKSVWAMTSDGTMNTEQAVMGCSESWPALTESIKATAKTFPEGRANSQPAPPKFAKSGDGGNDGDEVGTSGSVSSNGGLSSSLSLSSSTEMLVQPPDRSNDYSNRHRGPRESHGWVDRRDGQRRLGYSNRRLNNGNRRDQDRSAHDWNSSQSSNGRDFHMHRGNLRPRAMRPPMPAMMPFINPLPFQSYPGPVAFPDFSYQGYYFPAYPHLEPFVGNPFLPRATVPPVQPMLYDSSYQQRTPLLKQIEYYFSLDNLCKDVYLRENMDEHGWVSIYLIADFKRVKQLTSDVQFILDALRSSDVVEVQGDMIRRRHGWSDWVINSAQNLDRSDSKSSSQSETCQESLIPHMESVTLEEGPAEGNRENRRLDLLDISVP